MDLPSEKSTAIYIDRFREARDRKGLSQRALARLCELNDVLIYRYESGISDPSINHLVTIAKKLGVSIDYLVGLTDSPNSDLSHSALTAEEKALLDTFRREGWSGVIRLGAERIRK